MEKHVHALLDASIEKIRDMVDVNTVVGDPIHTDDGITIIPVSRVSYGFASGGSDLPNKANRDIFGGGSGAGVTVVPVAFLVVTKGEVRMLPVVAKPDSGDRVISMIPDVVDKITALFKKEPASQAPAPSPEQTDDIRLD